MDYKINTPITAFYQAPNAKTGLTVNMDVFDETQAKDAGKSTTMTEMGTTGRYSASFTPDAKGWWLVMMYDTAGGGKGPVIKTYKVTDEDVDSIGTKVGNTETNIRGADSDDLKTISDQIDTLESPAMVG